MGAGGNLSIVRGLIPHSAAAAGQPATIFQPQPDGTAHIQVEKNHKLFALLSFSLKTTLVYKTKLNLCFRFKN